MSGFRFNNTTGTIDFGGGGATALSIKDDDGLTITNAAGTAVANLTASGTSLLTLTGTFAFALENRTTDPGSPVEGRIYWKSDSDELRVYNGSTWTSFASSAITGSLTSGRVAVASGSATLNDDANFTFDTTAHTLTLGGSNKTRMVHTAGTLGTGEFALNRTATLPNTSSSETGMSTTLTLNGTASSGAINKKGQVLTLAAGSYTGNGGTVLLELVTSAVGTGTAQNVPTAGSSGPANKALYARADGSTAGTNIGGYFEARNGAVSIGVIGKAIDTSGVTSCVGVIGAANPANTNAIGVYATFDQTQDPYYSVPGGGQYALVANNGPNVSTQHCLGIFSQAATYFTIKNLGPWLIRTDPLAAGVIAYDQAYSLPTPSTAAETCSLRTFTAEGSGTTIKTGDKIQLNAGGYTAAGTLNAVYIQHDGVGTGADAKLVTAGNLPLGNVGQFIGTNGSTSTGYNFGLYASARQGLKNFSVVGRSVVSTNATHNIGVTGTALNASSVNIGVLAGLNIGDNPTLTSAALYCSNGSTAAPIAVFKDGTTTKLLIDDEGLITHTAGTVASGSHALTVTATMGTSAETAILKTITSAGSGGEQIAEQITLAAGFTGANATEGLRIINNVDGTGTSPLSTAANYGVYTEATGSSNTGSNVGTFSRSGGAGNGTNHWGAIGYANGNGTGPNNIGVLGVANGGTIQQGGFFYLGSAAPTLGASSALVASNGTQTVNIISGRDNTAEVFAVQDGGLVVSSSEAGFALQNSSNVSGLGMRVLRQTTTNTATPTEVTVDNAGASFFTLASGTTHSYTIHIAARGTAGTNSGKSGAWKIEVLAANNAGTTAIIGTEIIWTIASEVAGWDVSVVADDTNDRLAIKVTGDAASTISWRGWVAETTI